MIQVTKPFLPPKEIYEKFLAKIWESTRLTNNGQLLRDLELQLQKTVDNSNLLLLANGTLALQMAIKVLNLKGKIITTPFSFVATTSSIVWEGCKPIYADIDSQSLNIDPQNVENLISDETSGIIATHVFGNPCEIEALNRISEKYNVPVIYDGAHAFGVEVDGKSVLNSGSITACSFHATKLFHCVEGGALISPKKGTIDLLKRMRNFGHKDYEIFDGLGINGKNSEFHAAMGLAILPYLQQLIEERKRIYEFYLAKLKGLDVGFQVLADNVSYNYAYFPLIFGSSSDLQRTKTLLESKNIYTRRYFYPSLNNLNYVDYQSCPVADDISSRILCLPIYNGLNLASVQKICNLIIECIS